METVASDIAEIVPQMRPVLQDLHSPHSFDAESARFRLFDSIATFLKDCL
jgi:ABC-type cobalt transport system substrate-binding protein